jgi:hypothetical protein
MIRIVRCTFLVAWVLGVALAWLAAPAGAAPSGTAGGNPPPGRLNAVSCPVSPAFCFAAGDVSPTSSTDAAVIWVRNGTTWAPVTPAAPAGALSAGLTGASCPAANDCFAVGNARTPADSSESFAQSCISGTCTLVPTQNPTPETFLNSITCQSATWCMAVGDYFDDTTAQQKTLIETFNGTSWAVLPTPNPKRAQDSYLNFVFCDFKVTSVCTAVGDYVDTAGVQETLAIRYSNLTFKLQLPVNPTGSTNNSLNSVACPGAGHCVAVGNSISPSGVSLLVENWSAQGWTVGTPVAPPGPLGFFKGVSCKGASACTAVGYYLNTMGVQNPFAEAFNGTAWSLETPVAPAGAQATNLNAVDCTRPTVCVSVGFFNPVAPLTGPQPFAGEFKGNAWAPFKF